jgi:hypothetical protein
VSTPSATPLPAEPDPRTAKSEPLITIGAIIAAVAAVLALLVSFKVPIDERQHDAILGAIVVIAPIVTALWGRAKVYSPRTVVHLLAQARKRTTVT